MINPWKDMVVHWTIPRTGLPARQSDVGLIVVLSQIFVMLEYGWRVEAASLGSVSLYKKGQTEVCEGSPEDFLLILALVDFCAADLCRKQGVIVPAVFDSTMLTLAQYKEGAKIICGRGERGKAVVFHCPLAALGKVSAVMAMGINDAVVLRAAAQKSIGAFRDDLKRCQMRPDNGNFLRILIEAILR
jgi:hypothetical protein